jgi:predicted ATPase
MERAMTKSLDVAAGRPRRVLRWVLGGAASAVAIGLLVAQSSFHAPTQPNAGADASRSETFATIEPPSLRFVPSPVIETNGQFFFGNGDGSAGYWCRLAFRSLALWVLGHPQAAAADADRAIQDAREIGYAATLMHVLAHTTMFALIPCGNYSAAKAQLDELAVLAEEKGASFRKALGTLNYGCLLVLTGKASEAIPVLIAGLAAYGSTGATIWKPQMLSHLAQAYADLGQFDDAWRCIGEAMTAVETTKEKWIEAELHRIAGEIALKSKTPSAAKAEACFERALAIARQQQSKSWELRAAMSLARVWSGQGKVKQARELLAPVYGWFTEGFDTRDLKEAKTLLEELAS